MAVFFGAYALSGSELPRGLEGRVCSIMKSAGEPVVTHSASGLLVHAELGIWPDSAIRADSGSCAVVAGDPVFCVTGHSGSRPQSISAVAGAMLAGRVSELQCAEGSYFAAVLDRHGNRFSVAVDKLGVRPVYFSTHDNVVYAASALWMLEQIADLPKRCDWRGVTETAAFGFPLGDRTAYLGIFALGPGQAMTCRRDGRVFEQYWDWRQPQPAVASNPHEPLVEVERAFHAAVDDRSGLADRALAFLSGGMDSRFLATRLRERGVTMDTLNFAPAGSADLVYGKLAADALGTRHFEFGAGELQAAPRAMEAISAWRSQRAQSGDIWAQRQRLVWSGEGGSVSLGHVYMSQDIADLARSEGLDRAAEAIQQATKCGVSPRMFKAAYRQLATLPLQGIREELHRNSRLEPGRACHMFFMLNDQRRHLANHYENIHRLQVDYHLPFFDGRFLKAIFSSDIDAFIGHRLYNRLFERLPFGLGQVPWQAYPGHVPCPVAGQSSLRKQWSDGWFDDVTLRAQRQVELAAMDKRLRSDDVPKDVLDTPSLLLAVKLTQWGIRDCMYMLTSAKPYMAAHSVATRA